MFSRALASSVRSMGSMTAPLASSGPTMSRYFSASASVAVSKIFIGGLSWNVDEPELKEHFERFGSITDIHIPTKPDGERRGFAFVEFGDDQPEGKTSQEVAEEAIAQVNQTEIDGRSVTVNLALERRERGEGGFSRGGGGGFSRGGGGGYGRGGGGGGYGRGRGGGRGGSRGGYGGGGRDNYGGGRDNYGGGGSAEF